MKKVKNRRVDFNLSPEKFRREFFAAYEYFLSFDELENWANKEVISVTQLKKVYPIKDFAKYYIHQWFKKTGVLPKVRDLPKVVLQAYNSQSYKLYREAGFRDPKEEMYLSAPIEAYNIPDFKEADVFGVTITHFTQYPKGVFVDIPFKPYITAHYFNPNTLTYVFFTKPEIDWLYPDKVKYQELYQGIFNIEINIIKE